MMISKSPIQSAPECWKDGYDDGQNNPFSEDRNEECKFNVVVNTSVDHSGCKEVTENTEEVCEGATD